MRFARRILLQLKKIVQGLRGTDESSKRATEEHHKGLAENMMTSERSGCNNVVVV